MEEYDCVIIGAGPAGGQCARELSFKKRRVLLVDQAKSFSENNYSSGGVPQELIKDFELPLSIIGSYWNKLSIVSTHAQASWQSPRPFGPVVHFDKLREFLKNETERQGGHFHLGWQYLHHEESNKAIQVQLKNLNTRQEISVRTHSLVDATGTDRKALMKDSCHKEAAMAVAGIEYHIRVNPDRYQSFEGTLTFFLGQQWMPQGYAWIFPMDTNQLKVGVIRYFKNKRYLPYEPSYQFYLDKLLGLCAPSHSYEILDRHGKTIRYTLGQKDQRYKGAVLAIGDAISGINPLGCEGIRHALVSGREAACAIDRFLDGHEDSFKQYSKKMTRYFGRKWFFSEKMASFLYTTKQDRWIDRAVKSFSLMNNKEIIDVIFHYRFYQIFKSYARSKWTRLVEWIS